eukprot:m.90414 g.90414  ORF g.90414 m.90414 type:complete len:206 (-) comp26395_c0_seq2:85-702(-)
MMVARKLHVNWTTVAIICVVVQAATPSRAMDYDDMVAMYGNRAEKSCRKAFANSGEVFPSWSEESCRTFQSIVEEFFNMKASAVGRALKRIGHDSDEPWNHFENFDDGINKAIGSTSAMIANSCGDSWGIFQQVIKVIADDFQKPWVAWLVNTVFPRDKKFAADLGDGKWDFKLQDENDDYPKAGDRSGMAQTGRSSVRVGSTRL